MEFRLTAEERDVKKAVGLGGRELIQFIELLLVHIQTFFHRLNFLFIICSKNADDISLVSNQWIDLVKFLYQNPHRRLQVTTGSNQFIKFALLHRLGQR
jgi:hypothetical protein